MSLASRAMAVPATPMAKPTSAARSAGASFVPSPVTATTSLRRDRREALIPVTSANLSLGEDLASTLRLGQTASNLVWLISPDAGSVMRSRKVSPSMATPPSSNPESNDEDVW